MRGEGVKERADALLPLLISDREPESSNIYRHPASSLNTATNTYRHTASSLNTATNIQAPSIICEKAA